MSNTTLSRADMEEVIRSGGSVLHKGQHLTRLEHLPSEADLADGDSAATQAALDGLAVQRAALDEQERRLLASQAPTKGKGKGKSDSTPPADPPSDPPPGGEG